MTEPGAAHEGDPRFAEKRFVDTSPWVPPWYHEDAFTKRARTYSDVATEEAESTPAGVNTPGLEPGPTEFSYGKGNMVPLDLGPGPTQVEIMAAIRRTDPADPTANHEDRYVDWIRE